MYAQTRMIVYAGAAPRLDAAPIEHVHLRDEPDALVLEARLSGFKKKDLSVEVRNDVLTIVGRTQRSFFNRETRALAHRYTIPRTVDSSRITASFKGGLLSVVLPKVSSARRVVVPIRVQESGQEPARPTLDTAKGRWSMIASRIRALCSAGGGAQRPVLAHG